MSAAAGLSTAGQVFFGSLCAGTFGLGVWQTNRFLEKRELVEQRQRELSRPPRAVDTTTVANSFGRYTLSGTFHHDAEFLVGPRGAPPGAMPGTNSGGMSVNPQGYYIVTPFSMRITDAVTTTTSSSTTIEEPTVRVLVNRGWIPRSMVPDPYQSGPASPQKLRQTSAVLTSSPPSPLFYQWERPVGTVQVTAVPGKREEPKYIKVNHDLTQQPPRLFWFDWTTMQKIGGLTPSHSISNSVSSSSSSSPSSSSISSLPILYWTQVRDSTVPASSSNVVATNWPVQPTADTIGEFFITPEIHAAYAATWFSLSVAGVYMTRKMITRGRA